MPYMRGDYMRGDYMRGDFLGIGKALKKGLHGLANVGLEVAHVVGSAALHSIPIVGPVIGAAADAQRARAVQARNATVATSMPGGAMTVPVPTFTNSTQTPGTAIVPYTGGGAMTAANMIPRGYHLNKATTYYRTREGAIAMNPPGTKVVKNRSMNWANHRALGRAERRIGAFVHHASKYIRWVHPTRKGTAHPKFGRRKKR